MIMMKTRCMAPVLLFAAGTLALEAQTPAPRTVRYELKLDELKYAYGVYPPVARLRPGDTLETNTVDGEGKAEEAAGRKSKGPNALTGPFYIEGAAAGDTLSVRFLSVEVDGNQGYG